MYLIFLGAPGSGKGTQSLWIEKEYNIPHISTGDMFRAAIAEGTQFGKLAASYIDGGNLVPDDITIGVVEERLKRDDCKRGFLFDGFPRTIAQAVALDELLKKLNIKLDGAVYLEVNESVLAERITLRRVCPKCGASYHKLVIPSKVEGVCDHCGSKLVQRKDDNEEALKVRLAAYKEQTEPLIEYYSSKGLLRTVDAMQSINKVSEDIKKLLEK